MGNPFRRQEEKSGERKLLLEDVVGAAPGVKDMGAVGWGAAAATGVHDRDGKGGKFEKSVLNAKTIPFPVQILRLV